MLLRESNYHQVSNISRSCLSGQLNCWSLRCSWSGACRRCSNYIFILYLTPGFNRLGKDKCKKRRGSFKFWYLLCLILEILRYVPMQLLLWLAHNNSPEWTSWHLRSLATQLFVLQFVQTNIKESVRSPITGALWSESTSGRWIQKGPVIWETFPFYDVIIQILVPVTVSSF